ncbi:hypothetical protein CJO71_06895 [Burkholderia ubonensis]|uniref:Uncharacterized protein n=1 Tax=Burkholderia ubonensis TaxID=101571 RepID=A0AB74D517_9BURK|nr:hypothetical protein [Burkholderia ubonensis]PAJ81638.1 hypothetical protein CJO71_06895 [Burkholderia ubonensis]PAJ99259.1 hypothetical protein CJO68_21735 [Burkholderia ubonensis]RQP75162.1 hypothetical protein DF015_21305 [Burkholderia ubonensis]RQP92322.1 hypothetical protein DF012_20780 [Burkholderia ubonensis]
MLIGLGFILIVSTWQPWRRIPGYVGHDMRTIVLKVGSTVVLTADMEAHNGTLDEHGKPDMDFMSASTVVHIGP